MGHPSLVELCPITLEVALMILKSVRAMGHPAFCPAADGRKSILDQTWHRHVFPNLMYLFSVVLFGEGIFFPFYIFSRILFDFSGLAFGFWLLAFQSWLLASAFGFGLWLLAFGFWLGFSIAVCMYNISYNTLHTCAYKLHANGTLHETLDETINKP